VTRRVKEENERGNKACTCARERADDTLFKRACENASEIKRRNEKKSESKNENTIVKNSKFYLYASFSAEEKVSQSESMSRATVKAKSNVGAKAKAKARTRK